jgi:sphingolipid delta-4 desaturase
MTEDTERRNRFFDETSNFQSEGKIQQPWLMSTDDIDYDEDIYEESFVPTEAVAVANPARRTGQGTKEVSRDVWDIIRVSDGCIREPVALQIERILAALGEKELLNGVLPPELANLRRLLLLSKSEGLKHTTLEDKRSRLMARYWMLRYYEDAIDQLQVALRPAASTWHDRRRADILRDHPEVARLMHDEPLSIIIMIFIIVTHLWIAVKLHSIDGATGWIASFFAAACYGAFCAFGFQALNHELMHSIALPGATFLSLVGSGCTLVPWFSYYFSGGHARHHKNAGTPNDIDREAFFWAWERVPASWPDWLDGPAGSILWASLVGIGLPVLYVISFSVCLLGNWRANVKELGYFAMDSLVTLVVHALVLFFGGAKGLLYMVISMGFGNGFLMHPLIGFWLMQHLCHSESAGSNDQQIRSPGVSAGDELISFQPTASYSGSAIWNLLNFNCLSHVEHHDFSRVPWTNLPRLKKLAPEYYEAPCLAHVPSITGLIWHWINTKGNKINFACILAKYDATARNGTSLPANSMHLNLNANLGAPSVPLEQKKRE